ncbi:tyrosine-type recombinase/integrase [Celeribacter sp. ULVN23_4]
MTKTALTDAYLRKLKPTGKSQTISDAAMTGLRARISAKGKISFALQARDASNELKTVTLGQYPEMSLKQAREEAARRRLELKAGVDVTAEKRRKRAAVQGAKDAPTLRELLREYEATFGAKKKVWSPAGPKTEKTQAGRVVERVFEALLDKSILTIKVEAFAKCVNNYKPARQTEEKKTANGQASKARAYLAPVLDWAAGRKSYAKLGAGRVPKLEVASLDAVHDPATTDPSITGMRKRVLTQVELEKILPLLKYPAPQIGGMKIDAVKDFRPIALRFMLYTAARREEVVAMRWRDLDRKNSVWRKPSVKSTKGGARGQDLPLSGAAIDILRSLPGWDQGKPEELVFPNSVGGELGNWTRIQTAIYKETGTSDWNRHDLRRTAATLMKELHVPLSEVERILAHKEPLQAENLGGAASHYLHVTKIMTNSRDPQEEALSRLAEAFELIEAGAETVSDVP